MTIGDLQAELAKLDSKLDVMILLNGTFTAVIDVMAVTEARFAVIRGRGATPQGKKFSVNEQGLVGHLARAGLNNERIGEILGRPATSVAKTRKTLGC